VGIHRTEVIRKRCPSDVIVSSSQTLAKTGFTALTCRDQLYPAETSLFQIVCSLHKAAIAC
jgi:hypothetical protein